MPNDCLTIAFLGTGLMGQPMARRLVDAGFDVTVWNRSPEKAKKLEKAGAKVVGHPDEAARGKDIVITMLSEGRAVNQVLFDLGVFETLHAGTLVIDMSSIKPREAKDHEETLKTKGIRHLDAPVSGGTQGAADGSLAIMVGGDRQDFKRAEPIFKHLGRATLVGPAGSGQLSKLANQAIVATNIGGVAEALLLASSGPQRINGRVRRQPGFAGTWPAHVGSQLQARRAAYDSYQGLEQYS